MNRLPGGPTDDDDRAVSDMIGYVMTFSVLVAAVAVVSSAGFEQLQEMRTNEQLNNAERAFLLVERNVEEIQQAQATVRSSEIDLHAGKMAADFGGSGASEVDVTVNGTDVDETVQLNDVVYELEDRVVAYEGGNVFYSDEHSNDVLSNGPEIVCRDDEAVLSFVRLQGPANRTFLAGGTIRITARHNESRLLFPKNRTGADSVADSEGVTVHVESSRYDEAWETFFEEDATGWDALPGSSVKYRRDGDGDDEMQVFVRKSVVNVSIRR
jgi:hypothetical protein